MKLNGWQRLWVVLAALWILPVAIFTWGDWPSTGNVSKGEVYARMNPNLGRRLTDYYGVLAAQAGIAVIEVPRVAQLQADQGFMGSFSAQDQKDYLAYIDPVFAKSSPLEQNAYLERIIGIPGETVDIDGHTVQFIKGIPEVEMNQTAKAYYTALRRILADKRARLLGEALAAWAMPAIGLLMLGLAVRWVRRGFSAEPK